MPELAAMFLAGVLVTFLVGMTFGYFQRARYHKKDYRLLQDNLKKVGFRWNELNLSLDPLFDFDKQQSEEYGKARLSTIIFVGSTSILSWLGLVFLLAIWVSLSMVGKTKTKRRLFESELAFADLPAEKVKRTIQQLQADD